MELTKQNENCGQNNCCITQITKMKMLLLTRAETKYSKNDMRKCKQEQLISKFSTPNQSKARISIYIKAFSIITSYDMEFFAIFFYFHLNKVFVKSYFW